MEYGVSYLQSTDRHADKEQSIDPPRSDGLSRGGAQAQAIAVMLVVSPTAPYGGRSTEYRIVMRYVRYEFRSACADKLG